MIYKKNSNSNSPSSSNHDSSCSQDKLVDSDRPTIGMNENDCQRNADNFDSAVEIRSGQAISDKYILINKVGEGGMGTVWIADQLVPFKRQVAIKFLKPSSISEATIARFAIEHQVLANMDHRFIAKIYDCGRLKGGSPFMVMEYVQGIPLTRYCDHHKLSLQLRMHLFLKICTAIEHAHQKGIIHRDLKPSNILISEEEKIPVPKVIDFGLAKSLPWSGLPNDGAIATNPGVLMGTLAYMSPEQIVAEPDRVDTRADIYSLGSILYELIASEVPFLPRRNEAGGWMDSLRQILEEDAVPPSIRISSLHNFQDIENSLNVDVKSLIRQVRGDLDCIILKSLSKYASNRYESVAAFRKDIENFLCSRPIAARPLSLQYRFRKFVKRHFLLVNAAVLLAVALVVGLAGTTWGLIRARRAEAEAQTALEANRTARQRISKAAATLNGAITLATLNEPEYERLLLRQIFALHEVSTDERNEHERFQLNLNQLSQGQTPSQQLESYYGALEVLEHLKVEHPLEIYRLIESDIHRNLARLLRTLQRDKDALREYEQSLFELNAPFSDEANGKAGRVRSDILTKEMRDAVTP